MEFLPTGSDVLDLTIGGGIPIGKICNIIGDKSSGKSLLSSEIIAQSRKKYGDRLVFKYDDIESGYSFDSMNMYGFDIIPESEEDNMSDSIEEFDNNFQISLDDLVEDQMLIYIVDCLDALTSDAEIKRGEERRELIKSGKKCSVNTYGLEKQKFLGQFFREKKKQIKQKNVSLIIISQIRDKIGVSFGRKWMRTGGRALDFYASQILVLAESEKYEIRNKTIGICTKIKGEKIKVGRPFQTCFVDILFNYGIDNVSTNLKYLYDLKTDSGKDKIKKRDKIKWDNNEYTIDRLVGYIEENNLENELTNRVKKKWNEEENKISIFNMGRKLKRDIICCSE